MPYPLLLIPYSLPLTLTKKKDHPLFVPFYPSLPVPRTPKGYPLLTSTKKKDHTLSTLFTLFTIPLTLTRTFYSYPLYHTLFTLQELPLTIPLPVLQRGIPFAPTGSPDPKGVGVSPLPLTAFTPDP